nr:hypothetical protein [Desulfobacterales bacterium]
MKKMSIFALILMPSASTSMAHASWGGCGSGEEWGRGAGGCCGIGPGAFDLLDLTRDHKANTETTSRSYMEEIIPLRSQLLTKRGRRAHIVKPWYGRVKDSRKPKRDKWDAKPSKIKGYQL